MSGMSNLQQVCVSPLWFTGRIAYTSCLYFWWLRLGEVWQVGFPSEEQRSGILWWYLRSPISWKTALWFSLICSVNIADGRKTALEQPALLPACSHLCRSVCRALVSNRGQIWLLCPNSSMQRLLMQGVMNPVCSTPMKLLCCVFFNHLRFSGSRVTEIHHCISCHMCIPLKNSI